METNTNKNEGTQAEGFRAEPRVYLSKDGEYLIHILPGNMTVRKHVNFYKKILGVDFVPKAKTKAA